MSSSAKFSYAVEEEPTVSETSKDLQSIGIELDERLIERFRSLGMDALFQAASTTSRLAASKDDDRPLLGEKPKLRYSTSHDTHDVLRKRKDSATPLSAKELQVDEKFCATLLRELDASSSSTSLYIEPQFKVHLNKMIDALKCTYARSSEKFVVCLVGKVLDTKKHSNTKDAIYRSLLEERYVNYDGFHRMIGRVYPAAVHGVIVSLFRLLCYCTSSDSNLTPAAQSRSRSIRRTASNNSSRINDAEDELAGYYIDIMGFLNFLKTASSNSRRSFETKSKLAGEVEFWNRSLSASSAEANSPLQANRSNSVKQPIPKKSFEYDLKTGSRENISTLLSTSKTALMKSTASSARKQRNGLHSYQASDKEIRQIITSHQQPKMVSLMKQEEPRLSSMNYDATLNEERKLTFSQDDNTTRRARVHAWSQEYRRGETSVSDALGSPSLGDKSATWSRPQSAGALSRDIVAPKGMTRMTVQEAIGLSKPMIQNSDKALRKISVFNEINHPTSVAEALSGGTKNRTAAPITKFNLSSFLGAETRLNNSGGILQ